MACRTVCQLLQHRLASSAASVRPSAAEVRGQRSVVFSRELARQRALYPRTEKIEVTLQIPGLQGTLLVMNKGVSTPHSCARHLKEWYVTSSALALAYWRSCAALLGQVLQDAFKEDFSVELLRVPEVSGAFCCDVVLDPQLDAWSPSEQLIHQDLPWEPLEVAPPVALEVFSHSRCKQEEVEEKSAQSPKGTVMLYRCGDHVLLSGGPLVARTGLCSQYEVTAIHPLGEDEWGLHRRAQGLSLPLQLQAHHTVWRKLRSRAEKLVEVPTGSVNETVSDTLTPPSAPKQTPPPTPQQ
ncbi:unnamed protein product [Coregonus sp. 'balchen']|nr:unnamed protein product [Coregonus sp. 'balchen']